jgi:8-oxo-dGTP pyrophosphatase MutT (NUDIX family)
MDKMEWKVLSHPTEVWSNKWIKIQKILVQLPTGVKAKFYALKDEDAVAVLAVDDQRCAILNRQFRPALEKVITELPAGQVRKSEKRVDAVRREFAEETGLNLKEKGIKCLGNFYRNPARDTGSMHIYFGRVGTSTIPNQEQYEYMETIHVPLDELVSQVESNYIQDITTIFAVLMLQSQLIRGKIRL